MGCHRLTYHLTAEPRLRCVYNAADGDRNRVACPSALGVAVETNSYDAWGNRTLVSGTRITQRGYTGHEHLPEFGLINMNARLYDPVIGRMLSPDPYVQNPYFSQNYNRYSYCLNNPLKYTDPTGMIYMKDDRYVDNTIDAENDRLLAYHMGGFGGGGGGGFVHGYGDGSYAYEYNWRTGKYINTYTRDEVSWNEVSGWLESNNHIYSKTYFGYNYLIEHEGDPSKYYYWSYTLYYNGAATGDYPNGFAPTQSNPNGVIPWLNKANQYNSVATTIIEPAAAAGKQTSNAVRGTAQLMAREAQAAKVLGVVQGVARGFNIAGIVIGTTSAGVNIYNGNANPIHYVDVIAGSCFLVGAGATFFLVSNPAGWTVLAVGGAYFTGRMLYDWYTEYKNY